MSKMVHAAWARIFRLIPAIVLAEPFELLWAVYGGLVAMSIVFREARHQTFPGSELPSLGPGPVGVYVWAGLIFVGSLLMVAGLVMAGFRPFEMRPRLVEGVGLVVFSIPIAQDGYLVTAHTLSHGGPLFIYQVFSAAILWSVCLAAMIRLIAVSSPVGVLAISRVSRIRLVRKQLIEMRREHERRR